MRVLTGLITSNSLRRIFIEGGWVTFAQGASIVAMLLSVRVLTDLLTPASYGELGLLMTLTGLLGQLVFGPVSNGASRYYSLALEKNAVSVYLEALKSLIVKLLVGVLALLSLISVFFSIIEGRVIITFAIGATLFAIFSGLNAILGAIQGAARRRSVLALHQTGELWVRLCLSIIFIKFLNASTASVIWAYLFAAAFFFYSQYRLLFYKGAHMKGFGLGDRRQASWEKKIWDYSWPFAIWGVFTGIQIASDRWSLGYFRSFDDVGKYVVLYQVGYYPISMATGILMELITPIIYSRVGATKNSKNNIDAKKTIMLIAIFSFAFTCFSFVISIFFNTEIFRFIVAPKYMEISYLLPWMVLSGGLFSTGQVVSLSLTSFMKINNMMTIKIATGVIGLIFNVIGAYFFGIVGVVIAGALFSIIYLLSTLLISSRI